MLTTRAVGPAGFGGKVRDWNDRTHAETWRASWADHANRALANAGYQEEIDHRSYERQGLEKTPGIHLGKSACAMETRGIETERGEQNRLINRLNLEIQISRTELRNSGLTEPARRVADLSEYRASWTTQLRTHYVTSSKRCRRTVMRHGNSPVMPCR